MPRQISTLALLTLISSGCSSYSIEDGIWELSYNAQDYITREPWEIPNRRVRVEVTDSPDGPGEIVEIERLESQESLDQRRMYGDIPPGSKEILIKWQDKYWAFRMRGEIRDPKHISGNAFLARHRFEENTALEGRWQMLWVEPK